MSYAQMYLAETAAIAGQLDADLIECMASELFQLRARGGRLFLAGLGGGAANCSHAANDFRKLCGIQAIALCDNVSELTARMNDEGPGSVFADIVDASRAAPYDALFVFSVGGGADGVSLPIIGAIGKARELGMRIFGVVGRDGGATKARGDCVIVVPTIIPERVTPHTEAFQMAILHLLVSHPMLQMRATKW